MTMDDTDPWLVRWLPLLAECAGADPVLELGCGDGRDSATLAAAGLRVEAIELSAGAADAARERRLAGVRVHNQDFRAPFPLAEGQRIGVVLASLSLHYFEWAQTLELVERIHALLRPGGVLLCRLNSVNDRHYGGRGPGRSDEDNLYLVDGSPKRFFERGTVQRLFARGWRIAQLEELSIDRYEHPKVAWEALLRRD